MRVVLTGASGFVGQAFARALIARGGSVIAVSRSPSQLPFKAEVCSWDSLSSIRDVDAIVHLAGESVAQRWTAEAKKRILSSRVDSLARLREAAEKFGGRKPAAAEGGRKPTVLVSASAIGYYGDRGDDLLGEEASPGRDFLAQTCVAWERAADLLTPVVSRIVKLRFGMVLGKGGGALDKMLPPFRLGLGGRIGSGQQWVSWIELHDLVQILIRAIDSPQMKGVYNAVSPNPVRNAEFAEALAEVLGSKTRLPVPEFGIRLALGEMAEMLLGSQRVSPESLTASGFTYQYPKVIEALRACV